MTRRGAVLLLATALAAVAAVPTPESWFGHRMGADRKLVSWEKVVGYFDALAAGSDRVRVERIGPTVDGKPMIAVFIADGTTLRNLDRYREIQARLSDPRRTLEPAAEQLIRDGKSIVMITCSIHSTEVASTLTAIEYAHRLITEDTPKSRAILANTIFILVPSLNPDGVDIVKQWYDRTVGSPYEGTDPPELYHRYVGHDNNRDWYIFSQPETRNVVSRLHNVWHPQIVYDVHQQRPYASRMFVPPWMDPIDPNIDPILAQLCNAIGAGIAADLTSAGKTGVAINAMYDFWTASRHYQAYHGGLRILSESASAKLATPIHVRPDEISRTALGYDPRERSWNYLEPWRGGDWRLRDIVDYQLISMESCLYQAALEREDLLRSFYRVGKRSVARSSPYAFAVAATQFDPGSARKLLETLHFGLVEIERATAPFQAGGEQLPAGTFVIRMQQPYSSWAKTLLERQDYPDLRMYPGGPPKRPYDVTAQTLPMLMGVDVRTISDPFSTQLERPDQFTFPATPLSSGDVDSWRQVNSVWNRGGDVWRDPRTGDFRAGAAPGLEKLRRPRIGLYRGWYPSMDEGWTRWLFEDFGFRYTSVRNQDLHAANLNDRFDVIVFPDEPPGRIHQGFAPGSMPQEYTGGVGENGATALSGFVSKGGTLIYLNEATGYAIQHLGIDVKNVVDGLPDREFYAPGSILNAVLEPNTRLGYGLPPSLHIWSEHSAVFEVPAGSNARVIVRYPQDRILASGWLLGERYLRGRAALVDVPVGSGHVLLFGMRPQYRAQSYQTFKLFFNALLSGEREHR